MKCNYSSKIIYFNFITKKTVMNKPELIRF